MDILAAPKAGLTAAEALERLRHEGPNALPSARRRGPAALLRQVASEPMFLLLIAAASVYLLLGDLGEAVVLAASIVVVMAITVVQERRSERSLERLRDLSSPRALVLRDGVECRIAGAEVVRDDVLLLREGDRIAADARVFETRDLQVDESLLTGESVPVAKDTRANVFSGTLVVKGTGRAVVTATGARSELGRIGGMLATAKSGKTSLERETARLVRYFAAGALVLCVGVAVLYIVLRADLLSGLLAGLTLAMAMLPEEFPVVLAVFLALGAWRIAQQGVLTRRLPAIEILGAATVLCCDKTGTLTENRMKVVETWRDAAWRGERKWDGTDAAMLGTAALACEPAPFDPMERAILLAAQCRAPARDDTAKATLERHYPFAQGFLAVCYAWRLAPGRALLAMKGAPEAVVPLCGLSSAASEAALAAAGQAAGRGLRLLAIAEARWDASPWLDEVGRYPWRFLGFIALADPIRAAVPAAVGLCRRAGIRVIMITGDHPQTARAIALQAGLDARGVLCGEDLESLDDVALRDAAGRTQVFARVRPEQKLRLVNALRDSGEVVAMTGDGVNDAPALRAAHIGIAMGQRGTDVAREAASLVLLQDDFTSIVGTVRLGRRIHDNIRNAMRYLIAVHVPLAGMALLPLVAGWPLFLFPVHVVFLEFVIDPACTLVFEAERGDPRIMERPPRPSTQRLLTWPAIAIGFVLGAGVLAAVAIVYGIALDGGRTPGTARALAFATLVSGNLGLIFANRSHRLTLLEMRTHENRALAWIVLGATTCLAAALYWPAAAGIFRFEPPAPLEVLAAALAGIVAVLWYDLYKIARRRPSPV